MLLILMPLKLLLMDQENQGVSLKERERDGERERERERENKATTLLSTCRDNKGLELKHGVIALETQFYSCCFFHSIFIKVVSCYHGYGYVQTVMTTIDKKYQQLNDILRFYQ